MLSRAKTKAITLWNDKVRLAIYQRNRATKKMSRANAQENVDAYKRLKGIAQHVIKETRHSHIGKIIVIH